MKKAMTSRIGNWMSLLTAALVLSGTAASEGQVAKSEFKLFFETPYWEDQYDPSVLGFNDQDFVMIYQAHLGTWQDEFKKWPDVFNHNEFWPQLISAINSHVPDPNYRGVLLFDYESFPVTLYDPHGGDRIAQEKQKRIDAVLGNPQYNPNGTLTYDEALDIAEQLYHPYSRDFWLGVYRRAKAMRPNAKIGFYSLWRLDATKGFSEKVRKGNDHTQFVWNEVDVFAPYAYLGSNEHNPDFTLPGALCSQGILNAWIDDWTYHMEEKMKATGKRSLVLPFVSVTMGGSSWEEKLLPDDTIVRYYEQIWAGGCDGLIQWMAVYDDPAGRISEHDYARILATTCNQALRINGLGVYAGRKGFGQIPDDRIRRLADRSPFDHTERVIRRNPEGVARHLAKIKEEAPGEVVKTAATKLRSRVITRRNEHRERQGEDDKQDTTKS